MQKDRGLRIILALMLLFLVFLPLLSGGIDLILDWLWFGAEGYRIIYKTIILAQIDLSGWVGISFIAVLTANLLVARSISKRFSFRVYGEALEVPLIKRVSEGFRWLIWVGVLVLGWWMSQWSMSHWMDYLMARNGVSIGKTDPLFGIDIGFYLFQLPFRWFLFYLLLATLICCALSAIFLYLLEGGVWVTPRGPAMPRMVKGHMMFLGGLFFLLMAYRTRLAMYDLLFSARGLIFGAGYTDVHATLPILRVTLGLCLITAIMFFAGAFTGRPKLGLFMGGGVLIFWLAAGGIYPAIIQHFIVTPNEIDKERPYIERAIEFTRRAYGLDNFQEKDFSAVENLTLDDVRANDATMRNIRLWDHKPLLTTFAQLQEIRTYYDFLHVDNDRYWINGIYRQVSLSPRELAAQSLPSRNWINEHLTYTHGFGLCLSPVNEYTNEGLPEFFIKDIPPLSTIPLTIKRPEIYYGEMANNYCFVKTKAQEFDYPSGDQNVYTNYQGTGGLPVGGFWRRLLYAVKFGEINILLSTDITSDSRLMIYRQVLDRATRLAPFLAFDHDPFMVISKDGSLYWMLDGYTTSDRFPYSEPTADMGNYIRNSVKVTINAYSGQVRFYISDPEDPLIQVYSRLFPGVFEPLSAMPEDLRAHIRYPEEFFTIQAAKYATYHMTDPRVFYNKEDLWRLAQSNAGGNQSIMTPYYTIMRLAEVGQKEEFILMEPFTPARKDNMIAWMAARCDAPNYGKVQVFMFPKERLIYGPQQIESRIDQDPNISQQLTLWGQGGSSVIRGTLLVVPVRHSVLYVEPLYLAASAGGGLPQLKRVIVAYSNHVVMSDTLDGALDQIFGGTVNEAAPSPAPGEPTGAAAAPAAPATPNANTRTLIQQANQHYERALEKQRAGDWAGYGDEIKQLGEVLKKLSAGKQ
jgi:uncharacterized protein